MIGRAPRETILTALFNALVSTCSTAFTADTQAGLQTLGNASTSSGLFIGLPVVGNGIPKGALISSLAPLTLTLPATANALQTSMRSGFMTTGRRVRFARDIDSQPALFLRDVGEHLEYANIVLQEQTIKCEIWIYANDGKNQDVVPGVLLNNLLDAVQSVFTPDQPGTGMYTLGGLVSWCRMAGKIDKAPGDIDGQAMAVADVEITVP